MEGSRPLEQLPRVVVESPSLEPFQTHPDLFLCHPLRVALPWAEGLNYTISRGAVQPYRFRSRPCPDFGRSRAVPELPPRSLTDPGGGVTCPAAALLPAAILGWVGGGAIKNREREEAGSARSAGAASGAGASVGRRWHRGWPVRSGAMSDQQFALDSAAVAASGGGSAAEQPEGQAGAGSTDGGGGGGGGAESEGAKIDASKNEEDEG